MRRLFRNKFRADPYLMKSATTTASAISGPSLRIYERGPVKVTARIKAVGTWTASTLDMKAQSSADNSSFADISGAAITQMAADGTAILTFLAPAIAADDNSDDYDENPNRVGCKIIKLVVTKVGTDSVSYRVSLEFESEHGEVGFDVMATIVDKRSKFAQIA